MANPVNPYVAGNPVGDSPAFVGRVDVVREVVRVLRRPQDNAIVLYGQRRIGKTSILQHLAAQLPREGPSQPVYFDLQDKADWRLDRVLRELARTIAHVLGQPDPDLGDNLETAFRDEWLPDILDDLPDDCSLALLFDEFDVLADPQKEQAAAAFFPYLRRLLASDPGRLQFVFVIGRNVDDLDNIALSLFKGTPYQRVSLLSREDTADLVRLSENNGTLTWPDEAIERVWHLTNGHPFLTQQLCSFVWENAYHEEPDEEAGGLLTVGPVDVEDAVLEALEASRNTLEWLWAGLPPAERVVASALAEAGPGPITPEDLEHLLRESGVRVVIRELQNAPQLLQDWDLIKPAGDGYCFRVELLRRWIAKYKPLHRVQEELDYVEPVAEDFYQAGSKLYYSGQLDQAVAPLRQAIELNPNHVRANQLLADILLSQGQPGETRQLLERLYEYQPAAARHRLVQALLAQAQATAVNDEKLALYSRVLELDPAQPEATAGRQRVLEAKAQTYKRAEEWAEAVSVYKRLLAQPHDEEGEVVWREALEQCQEEEELARFFVDGVAALEQGDWNRAQRAFAEVIGRRPAYGRDELLAADLLKWAIEGKKATALARRLPGWAWALVGVLVIGLVGGGWALAKLQATPTPTPTITMAVTLTVPPTAAIIEPTAVTPTDTPTATPTQTPTATPNDTPTLTATPTQTPTATLIPVPIATPELAAPSKGSASGNPITFRWSGSLGVSQAYQVTARHTESGHVTRSELLTGQSWTTDLPGDRYGEWDWMVSVVQGGRTVTASSKWRFWFNPRGDDGDDGTSPGPKDTPKPTPEPEF